MNTTETLPKLEKVFTPYPVHAHSDKGKSPFLVLFYLLSDMETATTQQASNLFFKACFLFGAFITIWYSQVNSNYKASPTAASFGFETIWPKRSSSSLYQGLFGRAQALPILSTHVCSSIPHTNPSTSSPHSSPQSNSLLLSTLSKQRFFLTS